MWPLLVVLGIAFLTSCSDNSSDSNAPEPGVLDITTITTGPQADPDGYALSLDGVSQGAIGLNATTRIENIEPGDHTLQLTGLASNCTVSGDNPRTVTLSSGGIAPVSFQVNCSATAGGIMVVTITTGTAPDPDGYIVTLGGKNKVRIGVNDSTTFGGLASGAYDVGLVDVAPECRVQTDNPRPVTVTSGTSRVPFRISCP